MIICLSFIFVFSSQSGSDSDAVSLSVAEQIFSWFIPGFTDYSNKAVIIEAANTFIRKLGHITEFAALGASFMLLWYQYTFSTRFRMIFSFACGLVCAIGDEVHQLFVPKHSGNVTDVLIDSVGVLIGIFVIFAVNFLLQKRIKNENKRSNLMAKIIKATSYKACAVLP